ncbi:MAG: helix-turn-helix domain-containing protein [Legionellales bacterium]|jgi:transcriptional regulator with XRE-family HTH domain
MGKYIQFGELLFKLRQEAGIGEQHELAILLNTTQQTISRWEKGTFRPRDTQMAKLASILSADLNELLRAAGYLDKEAVVTFDKPLSLDALNPDNFERFCYYLLNKRYPNAKVHRFGELGHTQSGLDIEVIFPDKTYHTFQCKRVNQFGPANVNNAVNKHTQTADKKFLLLSRVASPQARDAIHQHHDWDIWDKEDISLYFRELSKVDQIKLVDIYFRGQRLALLGETEPGPWQTIEQFFAPFMNNGVFNHRWDLIERDEETQTIVKCLADKNINVIFLTGPGGTGKSRVLKAAIEQYEAHNKTLIRFLSPTEKVNNKSIEHLGEDHKIIVIDDAHERDDLAILFQYVATPSSNAKLLLSFRPYGINYIKSQAGNFSLTGNRICHVQLKPFTLEQATKLATQVLKKSNGPTDVAQNIAQLTLECPLATVIGAQIFSKEKIHFELVQNEENFRQILFGKFQKIIIGNIGSKADEESIKKLLGIIALLQPFHPDDESFFAAIESIEKLAREKIHRLLRLLTDGGILFKRGGKYRLSPDLLGDYIIEDICIGEGGRSTGYAEKIFNEISNSKLIENLVLNLGRLDWRLTNGDPSNSQLLDSIWGKIYENDEYTNSWINVITPVAYYQPHRALKFAEQLIRNKKHIYNLPTLIKYAAYNIKYLRYACECLWEIAKREEITSNEHSGQAIRILYELCSIEPNRPIEYNKIVVDFGLSLLERDDVWEFPSTPLDFLGGILQTENYTSNYNGVNVEFSAFNILSNELISQVRTKVIDATINLLAHSKLKIAIRAAILLGKSIQYPLGIFGARISKENWDVWTPGFVQTLKKIEEVTQTRNLNSLVLIKIIRAIIWHARHAETDTASIAKQIIASLPTTLEFRTTLALVDGFNHIFQQLDHEEDGCELEERHQRLVNDLTSTYLDGENLRTFIEGFLLQIENHDTLIKASPYAFYWKLIQSSKKFTKATIENALTNSKSMTKKFAGMALSRIINEEYVYGMNVARQFISSEDPELCLLVAEAYSRLENSYYEKEDFINNLREIFIYKDPQVLGYVINAIRRVSKNNQKLAIELIKCIDISISNTVADDIFSLFQYEDVISFKLLTSDDIKHFLDQMIFLPNLKGYWLETFLSKASVHHAEQTATFLINRMVHSMNTRDRDFLPCNWGPYSEIRLRFCDSPEPLLIFQKIINWVKSYNINDFQFCDQASKLFDAMFSPYGEKIIRFLEDYLQTATSVDIHIISLILNNAPTNFVFDNFQFVILFLNKAQQYGDEQLNYAKSTLLCSAIKGCRVGTFGQPFPQDIYIQKESAEIVSNLSRFSPEYSLYESLKSYAEDNILRAKKDT